MPTYSAPSSTNVYVPSHAATGGLLTGFSRNPKAFAFNRYAQIYPVDKMIGYYATWNSRQAARIHNTDLRDFKWKDGADAPTGKDNLETFAYFPYETQRYAFPFRIGDLTIKQADWPVLQAHAEMAAQQAMTGRTLLGYNAFSALSQWGTHTANIDGAGGTLNGNAALLPTGQNWTNGTSTNPNVKKTFNRVTRAINLDTLAVLGPKDIVAVINPNTAMQTAESPEITDYFKSSPFAEAQIRGDKESLNGQYGLPDVLYGHPLVIEDAVYTSNLKGTSPDSPNYILPDGEVMFMSRVGGLEGIGGSPAHSTMLMIYCMDDMTVQSYHDVNNEYTQGRVKSNFTVIVTNAYSGFYCKRALG